jgi:hypothetical protein
MYCKVAGTTLYLLQGCRYYTLCTAKLQYIDEEDFSFRVEVGLVYSLIGPEMRLA